MKIRYQFKVYADGRTGAWYYPPTLSASVTHLTEWTDREWMAFHRMMLNNGFTEHTQESIDLGDGHKWVEHWYQMP